MRMIRIFYTNNKVGQNLSDGLNRVKEASINFSISKSVAKAKTKIQREKKKYDYWIAQFTD